MFSGVYKSIDKLLDEVNQVSLQEDGMRDTFLDMIDYMLTDSAMTIEQACRIVLRDRRGNDPLPSELSLMLTRTKPVDVYIRMCNRDRVVRTILEHGIDIIVIGGGGTNLICPPTLIFVGYSGCLLMRHFNI